MPDPPRAPRLLEQLRQQIRYLHCSLRTEQCCVQWVRRFIRPITPIDRQPHRVRVEQRLCLSVSVHRRAPTRDRV